MNSIPSVLQLNNVSKRFTVHKDKSVKERLLNFSRSKTHREEFWALQNITLDITAGSTVGLVGHNGSGKSTLLKTIGGIIQPTSGSVLSRGRMAALLELGAGFHPDLTGRENVYLNAALLGLSKRETDIHFDAIVDFSGIEEFIDTQVKFYSSGMYVRLAFAVAIHVDPDILLVDEVLAVGDEPFQRKCMDKIAEFQAEGRTIILVSHSSDQVGRLCDRVVVLDKGKIMHDGEPAEGIRILRNGYESQNARERVAEHVTSSDLPYAIVGAHATTNYTADSLDVTVALDVDIHRPQESWGIGLSVENTLGLRLYGLTTFPLKIELPNSVGRHRIEFEFPDLRLGSGKYLVNIGLGNNAGTTFERRSGVATFDVQSDSIGHGIVQLRPKISTMTR